jgi:hypothetical protein
MLNAINDIENGQNIIGRSRRGEGRYIERGGDRRKRRQEGQGTRRGKGGRDLLFSIFEL